VDAVSLRFDINDIALLGCLGHEIPNFRARLEDTGIQSPDDVHTGIRILETYFDALVQAGIADLEVSIVVGGQAERMVYLRPAVGPAWRSRGHFLSCPTAVIGSAVSSSARGAF
jgi:hypothetical protein